MRFISACLAILFILIVAGCSKSSNEPTPVPPVPTIPVITGTPTTASLTPTTAVISSSITTDGGAAITARGVCWSTAANPTITGNHTNDGSGTGSFTSTITDLDPETEYYARCYATNSVGTVYGNELKWKTTKPDVFVVGYEENGTYSNARIWKNGVASTLSTPLNKQSWGRGVYVVKDDVYAVGYEFDGTHYTAKLWKNNVSTSLSDGVLDAQAFSVFVAGDTVYVAGYQLNSSGKMMATLWKNGVATYLTSGNNNNGQATSVLVSGSDVYVTVYDGFPATAKLWKNGVATDLPGLNAVAYSICKAGTDIYVAGTQNNNLTGAPVVQVWKNNMVSSLNYGDQIAIAYGVASHRNDVYVAGFVSTGYLATATLWKNGIQTGLTNGVNYARANAVKTIGRDVYVTGYERINNISRTKIWKNGVEIYSSNGNYNAAGFSIFVR